MQCRNGATRAVSAASQRTLWCLRLCMDTLPQGGGAGQVWALCARLECQNVTQNPQIWHLLRLCVFLLQGGCTGRQVRARCARLAGRDGGRGRDLVGRVHWCAVWQQSCYCNWDVGAPALQCLIVCQVSCLLNPVSTQTTIWVAHWRAGSALARDSAQSMVQHRQVDADSCALAVRQGGTTPTSGTASALSRCVSRYIPVLCKLQASKLADVQDLSVYFLGP